MQLMTSRYHSPLIRQAIAERGLVPIGITVGAARWLSYELAANLGPLAPHGGLRELEGPEFDAGFLKRLDQFGPEAIERMIASVVTAYQANGAVLLCFEKVELGEECHRRVFAAWWEEKTGQAVPELTAAQLRL